MNQSFIVLASRSPRRAELLAQIGVKFEQQDAAIDESGRDGETPEQYVLRMAQTKCEKIAETRDDCVVLGSDTVVIANQQILGKPRDKQHHAQMMALLSGSDHEVLTAVAVAGGGRQVSAISKTDVRFCVLSAQDIAAYWQTGEPADKAGGYAIQGKAALFVEEISGSYSGVMGLPLFETANLLRQFQIKMWTERQKA